MRRNPRTIGQAATEYMLILSVIVVAAVAGAYAFLPSFQNGVNELAMDVSQILKDHGSVKGGFGLAANSASGDGVGHTGASATAGGQADGTVANGDGSGL
jgi:hypothetical protein